MVSPINDRFDMRNSDLIVMWGVNWENLVAITAEDINGLEVGIDFRNVEYYEEGKYPNPNFYYVPMSCNHCREPKCVPVCPVEALSKDKENGLILHDKKMYRM